MRNPYKWGAKEYLASMEVGETRRDDGRFDWRGLQSVASHMYWEYWCKYRFRSYPKKGYREVTRLA